MKIILAAAAGLALTVGSVLAQSSTTKTTTVTENPDGSTTTREETKTTTGTIETFEPGSRFIVKETSGPITYSYGPKVVYATRGGAVLTEEQVRARVRVGVPVSVHYRPHGESRVVERIVVDD